MLFDPPQAPVVDLGKHTRTLGSRLELRPTTTRFCPGHAAYYEPDLPTHLLYAYLPGTSWRIRIAWEGPLNMPARHFVPFVTLHARYLYDVGVRGAFTLFMDLFHPLPTFLRRGIGLPDDSPTL